MSFISSDFYGIILFASKLNDRRHRAERPCLRKVRASQGRMPGNPR